MHTFNPDPEKERKIRESLSKQLGVDFYSPDDPEINRRVDVKEVDEDPIVDVDEVPGPAIELRAISVGDIIRQAQAISGRCSARSPVRRVLYLCCTALQQLVDRTAMYEELLSENGIAVPAVVAEPDPSEE